MTYSLEDGKKLIELARASIEERKIEVKGFEEERGVFVTLHSWPSMELRGCIGFPEPIMPLKKAIVEAAKAAAFHDPRFQPISKREIFVIDISILTVPELIKVEKPKDYLEKIEVGKDGLVVDFDGKKGLLLPQVFTEWNADVKKALEMTCEKAGLPGDAWLDKRCRFYKFQAQIFKEEKPSGNIVEEKDKSFKS